MLSACPRAYRDDPRAQGCSPPRGSSSAHTCAAAAPRCGATGCCRQSPAQAATASLWEGVKESVVRGQFAVLTSFVENDELVYRFSHLTFQEHLCSMMIAGMLSEEMERVESIMASAGVRKMLQGTW